MGEAANPVEYAVQSRKSVRGFLPDKVDPALIRRILTLASWAPSGSNIQPWKVHVVTGERRDALARDLIAAHHSKRPEKREYQYYPVNWRSPYIDRRRETGWGLYGLLGITKGDRDATARQHAKNFNFFGAPCTLLFAIDADLGQGSWLDYGMFLQNIMTLARSHGLHTCPQAAVANYPDIVKQHLGIPDDQVVVCGIALGYEDQSEPANQFRPKRMALDEFVTFHEG